MEYVEFGKDRPETVMLLHGGGLSWWNYREEAALLKERYHVVLPILDGHAGSGRPFTSIGANAAALLSFIDERLGGSVSLIGGLSLGGQVLLEMLSERSGVCRHALVESAMAVPSPLTHALVGPAFGLSYGLIRWERFARLQFRSLHMKPSLFDDYYRDTCQIKKADMIAFMKANTAYTLPDAVGRCGADVRVFAGGKETPGILKSARLIAEKVPGARLTVLPGLRQGEFSLSHAEKYAQSIREILEKE